MTTTKWMFGLAAGLLWHMGTPAAAMGQHQPAVVRTSARVLSTGATVTAETMVAVLEGLPGGCLAAKQRCGPRLAASGRIVRHSGLATVRAESACSEIRKSACEPVVTVQFLWN